jgi:hypothetical protein
VVTNKAVYAKNEYFFHLYCLVFNLKSAAFNLLAVC